MLGNAHRLSLIVGLFTMGIHLVQAADGPRSYVGHSLVRVEIAAPQELAKLEETGAIILNCVPGVGVMEVVAGPEQLVRIKNLGLPMQIRHGNVQELIDRDRAVALRGDPFEDFFLDYHRYDNGSGSIVWYMNELVARFPQLATIVEVGESLEGRTIWGLRVTGESATARPAVVYFGCEHSREWIATTVPTFFATYLLNNYGVDPAVTDLVDHVEFFLIPVMNPDGYEYTWTTDRYWRKNRRDNPGTPWDGVDLNRNWGEGWGGEGSSDDPSSETYRGESPFSEPETQVMRDFFLAHSNVRAQLDIHSFSQLVLWPFGYSPAMPPDELVYEDVGFAMRSLIRDVHGETYTAGPVYLTLYPASGVSLDWTYVQRDVLSFTYECRDTGLFGFELPADQIIPNNEELLPAMMHLAKSDWVRLAARFEYPAGIPATLTAGQDTVIAVDIIGQYESMSPASARLHYRYDPQGAYVEAPLAFLGGDSHQAILPATNCTSSPQYYFSAQTVSGVTVTDPGDAPAEVYAATVFSEVVPVVSDEFEVDSGWTVGDVDDDATTGTWGRMDPEPTDAQPGDDHTPGSGTDCFVTDGRSGSSLGTYDVDNGKTTMFSPVMDLTAIGDPVVGYWRWYSNDTGGGPNSDEFVVDISNDAGGSWVNVEIVGPAGPETSGGWFRHEFAVADLVVPTSQVQLRFIAADESPGSIVEAAIDDFSIVDRECTSVPGDFDGDGDVDAADGAAMPPCVLGPAGGIGSGCVIFDFDADGDVDLVDYAALQGASG